MVYKGLQSSFVALVWPWSGRSLPQGEPMECWDPGLGLNVVRPPVLPPPTMWPTQSLTGWHFCTWLANCSWLAGQLTIWQNVNLTLSPSRHLIAKCLLLWSGWPVVRCTPTPQAETSCGQVWYYFTFGSGWPVRCAPQAETSCGQVWYYFWSGCPVIWG